jgi:hypothetical protein
MGGKGNSRWMMNGNGDNCGLQMGGVKEEERGRRGGSAHPEMSDLPP